MPCDAELPLLQILLAKQILDWNMEADSEATRKLIAKLRG